MSKRFFDVVASLIFIFLSFPFMALIAALVKLSSPGPIIFRQRRIGLNRQLFTILKFRTMLVDTGCEDEIISDKNDSRITGVGCFLRQTHLDELPQLFNVLKGDMSLVGPRPMTEGFFRKYCEGLNPDDIHIRCSVKPGITGPAQVRKRILEWSDVEELFCEELSYVRDQTIWVDLGILLKTIPAVINKNGI